MTATRQGAGDTGARGIIAGFVSNGETLHEDIEVTENGTVIAGADDWEWQFNLYEFDSDVLVLSLSTTGDSTVTNTVDATVIGLRASFSVMAAIPAGDYEAFLGSVDDVDRRILWARGTITIREEVFWVD